MAKQLSELFLGMRTTSRLWRVSRHILYLVCLMLSRQIRYPYIHVYFARAWLYLSSCRLTQVLNRASKFHHITLCKYINCDLKWQITMWRITLWTLLRDGLTVFWFLFCCCNWWNDPGWFCTTHRLFSKDKTTNISLKTKQKMPCMHKYSYTLHRPLNDLKRYWG